MPRVVVEKSDDTFTCVTLLGVEPWHVSYIVELDDEADETFPEEVALDAFRWCAESPHGAEKWAVFYWGYTEILDAWIEQGGPRGAVAISVAALLEDCSNLHKPRDQRQQTERMAHLLERMDADYSDYWFVKHNFAVLSLTTTNRASTDPGLLAEVCETGWQSCVVFLKSNGHVYRRPDDAVWLHATEKDFHDTWKYCGDILSPMLVLRR